MGGGTEEIVQSFSERTQTRLSAMRELTDCRVGASDGRSFDLHKSLLVMQSTVLRCSQIWMSLSGSREQVLRNLAHGDDERKQGFDQCTDMMRWPKLHAGR